MAERSNVVRLDGAALQAPPDELYTWWPPLPRGPSPSSRVKAKTELTDGAGKRWYCIPCDGDFATLVELQSHQATHVPCPAGDCGFAASRASVFAHLQQAHGATVVKAKKKGSAKITTAVNREKQQVGDLAPPESMHRAANAALLSPESESSEEKEEELASDGYESSSSSSDYASDDEEEVTTTTEKETTPVVKKMEGLPWRYEVCSIGVHMKSQLEVHIQHHQTCPMPGCQFSANKRVMEKHISEHHGATASSSKKEKGPPSGYVCKLCGIPGHYMLNCTKGYVCKLCGVPGHLKKACQAKKVGKADKQKCPSGYTCNACGVTGEHVIYDCPNKLKRSDLQKLQRQQQQQQQQQTGASSTSSNIATGTWTSASHAAATSITDTSPPRANKLKPWRCDLCNKDFALRSQHLAHIKQHMVCSEPGCDFSAAGRVVKLHAVTAHSQAVTFAELQSSQPSVNCAVGVADEVEPESSSADEFVVYRGEKYRVEEAPVNGEVRLVLAKVTGE